MEKLLRYKVYKSKFKIFNIFIKVIYKTSI